MIDPSTGKPWMEYPYAEDGMDLWRTFEDYFNAFISRHYRNDEALLADTELQAWWSEVKVSQDEENGVHSHSFCLLCRSRRDPYCCYCAMDCSQTVGHGDLMNFNIASEEEVWGFAGPISTQQQLVRVLTTIAFTASAHHAAVNFGQYDFSGLVLNFSSMVRKPMPIKGDKAWEVCATGRG